MFKYIRTSFRQDMTKLVRI